MIFYDPEPTVHVYWWVITELIPFRRLDSVTLKPRVGIHIGCVEEICQSDMTPIQWPAAAFSCPMRMVRRTQYIYIYIIYTINTGMKTNMVLTKRHVT